MPSSAIASIPTSLPNLYAFEVSAKITKADIEWMAGEMKTAFQTQGVVDILIKISNWDGIELGAIFDGKSISAMVSANRHVRKYAVVGAPSWAATMINLFSPLTPIEEKTFSLEELPAAWRWVEQ